jgi:hypothetical protein
MTPITFFMLTAQQDTYTKKLQYETINALQAETTL